VTGTTVARSYAETLFALGQREGRQEELAAALDEFAGVLRREPLVRAFFESPRVELETKRKVLRRALAERVPGALLRFLLVVLEKRRSRMVLPIASQYQALLDEHAGRVHVEITLAREPDEQVEREIATDLSAVLGRTVIPHVRVDPEILGGIIVRYGDRLMDASLRRRLVSLRLRLLGASLPAVDVAGARGAPATTVES
jgi:F-type H+-transporting ATPase subunit delta